MYNVGVGVVLMIPLVLVSGELKTMFVERYYLSITAWLLVGLSGVAQFGVFVAIHFQTKLTPPLVINAAGGVKGIIITILGYLLYRSPVSMLVCLNLPLLRRAQGTRAGELPYRPRQHRPGLACHLRRRVWRSQS